MSGRGSWLAASVFFLAGGFLVAVPSVVRSVLFAALWGAKTSFDHSMVDDKVPTFLYWFAGAAFVLAALSLILPRRKTLPTLPPSE